MHVARERAPPFHRRISAVTYAVAVLLLLLLSVEARGASLHDNLVDRPAARSSGSRSGAAVAPRSRSAASLEFIDVDLLSSSTPGHLSSGCAGVAETYAEADLPTNLTAAGGPLSASAEFVLNSRTPTEIAISHKVRLMAAPPSNVSGTRILCATYTHDKKHEAVVMMRNIWGVHCDRHLIFTNNPDDPVLQDVPEEDVVKLTPHGGESYDNMWQKTREAFKFLSSQAWIEDFHFFFFCGDDTFMIPANLRVLLASPEVALPHKAGAPLFLGYRQLTRDYDSRGHARPIDSFSTAFVSGAGYVMNQLALQLAGHLVVTSKHCSPDMHASHEDVYLADCLRVGGVHSRDARNAFGEDRFVILSPLHMHYQVRDQDYSWWWRDYRGRQMPVGLDIVAEDAVLFHYMDASMTSSFERHIFGKRHHPKTAKAAKNAARKAAVAATDDGATDVKDVLGSSD